MGTGTLSQRPALRTKLHDWSSPELFLVGHVSGITNGVSHPPHTAEAQNSPEIEPRVRLPPEKNNDEQTRAQAFLRRPFVTQVYGSRSTGHPKLSPFPSIFPALECNLVPLRVINKDHHGNETVTRTRSERSSPQVSRYPLSK